MTDEIRFEARLAQALRDYADQAVLPFDPNEIADGAIDARPAAPRWIRLALVATLGVAAVVIVVVAAAQFYGSPVGIDGQRSIAADELSGIVANASNTPGIWDQTLAQDGQVALEIPMRSGAQVELEGFVAGRTTEMCGTDDAGDPLGCVLAWTALFETADDAEAAYDFYLAEFESPDGWNVPPGARSDAKDLGDEAVLYTNILDPDGTTTSVYLWREKNLLMGAASAGEMNVGELRVIAEAMQGRAE